MTSPGEAPRTDFFDKLLTRGVGTLAAAGAIFSAIHFGPKLIEDTTTVQSEAVGNVPGLVVGYEAKHVWAGKFYVWRYWLEVEQCPQDIQASEEHVSQTQSFNTDPKYLTPGCFADWVRVSGDTYSHFGLGSVIQFEGSSGEHLRK